MMKPLFTFQKFAKAPKNRLLYKANNSLNRRVILIIINTLIFFQIFCNSNFDKF